MKKITIAEPCHENWNDFTPTQRGAFCGSCQINVIDFSSKSNNEIKDILLENKGKHMCGRFSKNQLDDFNSDYHLWQNQSQNTFQSKFIFALVLVFGLTLFSCSNESQSTVLGQMNNLITETTNQISNNFINGEFTITDTNKTNNGIPTQITCDSDFEMGDIAIDYPQEIEMVMGEMPIQDYEEKIMTKGKVAVQPEEVELINLEAAPTMLLGMIAYHEEPQIVPIELIDTVKNMTPENNIVVSLTDKFEANLYPNPTKNNATIDINVLVRENYVISVFDSQGRIVKTLQNGIIEAGSKSFRIDLSDEKNGIYFIKIITDTQNESLKLIKTN